MNSPGHAVAIATPYIYGRLLARATGDSTLGTSLRVEAFNVMRFPLHVANGRFDYYDSYYYQVVTITTSPIISSFNI
jgi:hypothetical protein